MFGRGGKGMGGGAEACTMGLILKTSVGGVIPSVPCAAGQANDSPSVTCAARRRGLRSGRAVRAALASPPRSCPSSARRRAAPRPRSPPPLPPPPRRGGHAGCSRSTRPTPVTNSSRQPWHRPEARGVGD